jgi:hypothetical protein
MRATRIDKVSANPQTVVPLIASLSDVNNTPQNTSVAIEICTLVDAAPSEVPATTIEDGNSWHGFGYYHVECDLESLEYYEDEVISTDTSKKASKNKKDSSADNEQKSNTQKDKTEKLKMGGRPPLHPNSKSHPSDSSLHKTKPAHHSRSSTPSSSRSAGLSTPELAHATEAGISPQEMAIKAAKFNKGGDEKRRKITTGNGVTAPPESKEDIALMEQMMLAATEKKEYKSLEIGQSPTIIRTITTSAIHSTSFRTVPAAMPLPLVAEYKRRYDSLMVLWLQLKNALRSLSASNSSCSSSSSNSSSSSSNNNSSSSDSDSSSVISDNIFYSIYSSKSYRDIADSIPDEVLFDGSRTCTLLYRYRIDQDRLFSQFVQEMAKVSGAWVASVSSKLTQAYYSDECQEEMMATMMKQVRHDDRKLARLIVKHRRLAQDLIKEQYMHVQGAIAGDSIELGMPTSSSSSSSSSVSMRFKHAGIFSAADSLCSQIESLTSRALAEFANNY